MKLESKHSKDIRSFFAQTQNLVSKAAEVRVEHEKPATETKPDVKAKQPRQVAIQGKSWIGC